MNKNRGTCFTRPKNCEFGKTFRQDIVDIFQKILKDLQTQDRDFFQNIFEGHHGQNSYFLKNLHLQTIFEEPPQHKMWIGLFSSTHDVLKNIFEGIQF